jgi:hypothetical protein
MSELRIVRGNSFKTRIKVHALNPDMTEMSDFSLLDCTDLSLFAVRAWKAVRIKTWEIHSDDEIDVTWNAPYCMTIGIYGLEIMGRLDGAAWRFCNRDLFEVVETSAEANIPDGSFIEDGSYEMTADFQLVLRTGAVQSDWSVTDDTNPAFILNKPGYRGEFQSVQSLTESVTDPKLDDYALIKAPTGLGGNIGAYFYRYDGTEWSQAFMVESTMLSQDEWSAVLSGITSEKVAKLNALPTSSELTNSLATKQDVISDLAAIRSGAEAGATAYQKPAAGIPASDLAQAVRTSLQKADTAVQTEIDPVFTASPAHSITTGDIAAWDAKADKVTVVNHGTGSTTLAIAPNTFHVWGTVSALNITLTAPTDSNVVNLYSFQFTSGSTPTNLTLPSGVQWPKDNELTVEANMVYEINIRDNKATWSGWEVV